jgi:hypothetical protein
MPARPSRYLILFLFGALLLAQACAPLNAAPPVTARATPTAVVTHALLPTYVAISPSPCGAAGMLVYSDPVYGYCFAYPERFTLAEAGVDRLLIRGPALDQNVDPLHASLAVRLHPVPPGSHLEPLMNGYLSQFVNRVTVPVSRESARLGGEPAEVVEVIPGREGTREVLALHGDTLYHLAFSPSVRDFSAAASEVETLFRAVLDSFSFFEPDGEPVPAPAPQTISWFEFGRTIDLGFNPLLALVVEPWTFEAVPISPDTMFADSHPAYLRFRLVGYYGGRSFRLPYPFTDPGLFIYRTADFGFEGANPSPIGFATQAQSLAWLLRERPALSATVADDGPQGGRPVLPFLPWLNSAQMFVAQPRYLEFSGGAGIRYLTLFAQDAGMVTDRHLFYTFQGLSDDGQLYVAAVLPVISGVFPVEPDPDTNRSTWRATLETRVADLQVQDGARFAPSLALLDELITSLAIKNPQRPKEENNAMSYKLILKLLLLLGAISIGCGTAAPTPVPVQPLQLVWPPPGEPVDAAPILQWVAFPGATQYHVQVRDGGTGEVAFVGECVETVLGVNPSLPTGRRYDWSVEARDNRGATLAGFTSDFAVMGVLEPVWPEPGGQVSAWPVLQWKLYGAAAEYGVVVVRDDLFPPAVVLERTTTATELPVGTALEVGDYSWIVHATDAGGATLAELTSTFIVR